MIIVLIIRRNEKDYFIKTIFFVCILLINYILNLTGIIHNGDERIIIAILHSLSSAIKAFGLDIDTEALYGLASNNFLFALAIFLSHITAFLWTFLVVITLFGKNFINLVKINLYARRDNYIIIGDSKEAIMFMESLSLYKLRRTILILDKNDEERKKELMNKGFAVINSVISLKVLNKIGINNNKNKTTILALSNQDEKNLKVAEIVYDIIKDKFEINESNIYAYIMYSYVERAELFDFVEKARGRIKFFNVYEARARKFLIDYPITKIIPKKYIDTKMAVLNKSYKISNIFVGFGATNSQILKKSICNGQLLGCNYRALIMDKDINDKKLAFMNGSKGLFDNNDELEKLQEYLVSPNEKYNIEFVSNNVLAIDFYSKIIKEVEENDYSQIIIALGSDILTVETALELRQKLYELDINNKATIFAKVIKKSTYSKDSIINANAKINKIITFGVDSDILNEEYIISEKLDYLAKRVAINYNSKKNNLNDIIKNWDNLSMHKKNSNRYSAMAIQIKLNLLGFDLERDTSIDSISKKEFYNSYDEDNFLTNSLKELRYDKDKNGNFINNARNNLARLEHQRWNAFYLVNGWTKLPIKDIGIGQYGRQNELAKKHACITTFEGLEKLNYLQATKEKQNDDSIDFSKALVDGDTIYYDYEVMDNLYDILIDLGYSIVKH